MLTLKNVSVSYGDFQALRNVSLEIQEGELIALVGANAAGKSTLINTISGFLRMSEGDIEFEEQSIKKLEVYDRVKRGIIQVPEGREIFHYMTVKENLDMGAYTPLAMKKKEENIRKIYELFPVLRERQWQLAVSLSGGEQQMLAIARGLMSIPKILMLDEPSLGLAPILVGQLFGVIMTIKSSGCTILLVEQNVSKALKIAHRGYVLENGRIVLEGSSVDLLTNPNLKKAYLGL